MIISSPVPRLPIKLSFQRNSIYSYNNPVFSLISYQIRKLPSLRSSDMPAWIKPSGRVKTCFKAVVDFSNDQIIVF